MENLTTTSVPATGATVMHEKNPKPLSEDFDGVEAPPPPPCDDGEFVVEPTAGHEKGTTMSNSSTTDKSAISPPATIAAQMTGTNAEPSPENIDEAQQQLCELELVEEAVVPGPTPSVTASNEPSPSPSPPQKVVGVKVMCKSERENGKYVLVDVDSDDPIFTEGELSATSTKIRIPLLAKKCSTVPISMASVAPTGTMVNKIASTLMGRSFMGRRVGGWSGNIGTVLFVRKDKKPLAVNHLKAMWLFNECFEDYEELYRIREKPDFKCKWPAYQPRCLEEPTKEYGYHEKLFRDFWIDHRFDRVQEEKKLGISDWETTPNPYDI